MSEFWLLVIFFLLAAVADVFTVWWHRCRERGHIIGTVLISLVLETLSWAPIWWALTQSNWKIAAVSIIGSGVGTATGMLRFRDKHRSNH